MTAASGETESFQSQASSEEILAVPFWASNADRSRLYLASVSPSNSTANVSLAPLTISGVSD